MQRMANINETGRIDKATIEMMDRPRCQIPDYTLSEGDINALGGIDDADFQVGNYLKLTFSVLRSISIRGSVRP